MSDLFKFLLTFPQLEIQKVGPLIIQGAHHRVYSYAKDRIIKVPRKRFEFLYSDNIALHKDLAFLDTHFPGLAIHTTVLTCIDEKNHVILQDRAEKSIAVTKDVIREHEDVVDELIRRNDIVYRKTGCSLDFLGGEGVKSCILSLFGNSVKPHWSNMMIHQGSLRLVDTELHRVYLTEFSRFGILSYLLAFCSHHTNILFLKYFFGLYIK